MRNLTRKGQPLSTKSELQAVNDLAAKGLPQDFYRKEEDILGTNPLSAVRREPSAWNDTVDMGMEQQQILSPRVENAEEANVGAQVFGISSDFQKCLRHRLEQQVIELDLILEDDCLQFVWHREHYMFVSSRQKLVLSCHVQTCQRQYMSVRQ